MTEKKGIARGLFERVIVGQHFESGYLRGFSTINQFIVDAFKSFYHFGN